MKKILIIVLSVIMVLPTTIYAEEVNDYDYVLLNEEAVLKIENNGIILDLEKEIEYTSEIQVNDKSQFISAEYSIKDSQGNDYYFSEYYTDENIFVDVYSINISLT